MFEKGDDLFIIDIGRWEHNKEILIQKRQFVEYTNNNKELYFEGPTSLRVMSWAVSPTIEDATKFAVAYIIKTECFGESISKMDGVSEYAKLEITHSDLIFKYMDKVVER